MASLLGLPSWNKTTSGLDWRWQKSLCGLRARTKPDSGWCKECFMKMGIKQVSSSVDAEEPHLVVLDLLSL